MGILGVWPVGVMILPCERYTVNAASEERIFAPSLMLRSVLPAEEAAALKPLRTVQQLAVHHEEVPASTALSKQRLKRLAEELTITHAPMLLSANMNKRKQVPNRDDMLITTGVVGIDGLLGGGLATGEVTELFGSSGSGKTQLGTLACAAQLSSSDRSILVIDTGGDFSAKRLWSMVLNSAMDCGLARAECKARLLNRVRIVAITELPELLRVLDEVDELMRSQKTVSSPAVAREAEMTLARQSPGFDPQWACHLRLVVIDGVFGVCCGDTAEYSDSAGGSLLAHLHARLRDLAARHRLAMLVTNAASAEPSRSRQDGTLAESRVPRPALGRAWYHAAHTRLLVQHDMSSGDHELRVVTLVRHALTDRPMQPLQTRVGIRLALDGTVVENCRGTL